MNFFAAKNSCKLKKNSIYLYLALRLLHTLKNKNDIKIAKKFLKLFGLEYAYLYGFEYQTFTLHIIAEHLADDARLHGSLREHSMFHFEGSLGHHRNNLNGTRGVSNQYAKSNKFIF